MKWKWKKKKKKEGEVAEQGEKEKEIVNCVHPRSPWSMLFSFILSSLVLKNRRTNLDILAHVGVTRAVGDEEPHALELNQRGVVGGRHGCATSRIGMKR